MLRAWRKAGVMRTSSAYPCATTAFKNTTHRGFGGAKHPGRFLRHRQPPPRSGLATLNEREMNAASKPEFVGSSLIPRCMGVNPLAEDGDPGFATCPLAGRIPAMVHTGPECLRTARTLYSRAPQISPYLKSFAPTRFCGIHGRGPGLLRMR